MSNCRWRSHNQLNISPNVEYILSHIIMSGRGNCTEVTAECPVSATIYGYEPNLPIDTTLCVAFAILTILQLRSVCFFRIRTWPYMISLFIGCVMEIVGYIGGLIMHNSPWSTVGTSLQLICLIVAPSFTAAAISVIFKHIIVYCGAKHSLMRPRFIPLLMIGSDFLGIVVQSGCRNFGHGNHL